MELILYNGKISTRNGFASAIGCKDGIISKIGDDKSILKEKTEDTIVVNLNGKLVLPGFNDSHMHFLDNGYSFRKLDLKNARSAEDVVKMGRDYLQRQDISKGSWLEAYNWNDNHWESKRLPTRKDLDMISRDIPIVASRVCGHIVIVNSKALELLGINKNTPQPSDGSRFDLDENGEPNGVLHELFHLVLKLIPKPSVDEIKQMIMLAADVACKKGLTCVQTDDLEVIPTHDTADIIQAYLELIEEEKLPIRVREQCYMPDMDKLSHFFERGFYCGFGNDYFRLSCIKLIADGSLGGRTAWLLDDYSDEPGQKGLQIYKDEKQFFDLVEAAHAHHMPVAVHCIGDAAAKQTVDAIEAAIKMHPDIKVRHGIVHAQILNDDLCRRMKELDIQAYIQPVFIQSDMYMAETRIGDRIKSSYNWRTLYDMGIKLSMGTDSPVEDMDPIANLYSAVTRKSITNPDMPCWYGEEALNIKEAIALYTSGSAYASGEEKHMGLLEEGYLADITVLDKDIYADDTECLKTAQIAMTIVDGKIRYKQEWEQ